ncbi:MAG: right-handed parallel beta-helix repeat-containing protein, partial [Planctomycetota bacterium]
MRMLFLLLLVAAPADDWTGVWTGKLMLGGKGHEIELVLERGKEISGNFKIDEDTTGLRLQKASVEGDRITFECWTSGHKIALEGTRKKDAIEGRFVITRGDERKEGTWSVTRSGKKAPPAPKGKLAEWTGIWSGATMLSFQRSKVTLVLEAAEKGGLSGHLRPQEQKNLPLKSVSVDGDRIAVELSVGEATVSLKGTLAEDSIIGRFTMTGGEGEGLFGMWRVGRMGSWREKELPAIPKPRPIGELTDHEKKVFLPFYERGEKDFKIARTYYVSANIEGASNENNGLYPDHRGGKDGPFKDFNDWNVRGKLFGPEDGVKMVVREGTYVIGNIGEDGVVLDGKGDEFHPVILSGYPGERAVLTADGSVNVPIQVHGKHGIVENLVVAADREVKYDIIVTGDNTIVRNCVFYGPVHEDCIKITSQADHCFLFNNDVSGYGSQCVDCFGANILFRRNHVHHAGNWKANAFGTKGGTRNIVVASNVFHDLSGGINFGGTGSLEHYRKDGKGNYLHATTDPVAVDNVFYNIVGPAIDFQSCLNGVFEGNTIHDTAAGFRVGIDPEQFEGDWKDLVVGLPATRGTIIRNNRLANISGDAVFLVEER